MTPVDPSLLDELKALRREIERHNQLYHQHGEPEIPDQEYDRLFDRLLEIEREYPELVTPDSPSQRVGASPVAGIAEVRHAVPMLSLDKVTSAEELERFDARIRKRLETEEAPRFSCEPKID